MFSFILLKNFISHQTCPLRFTVKFDKIGKIFKLDSISVRCFCLVIFYIQTDFIKCINFDNKSLSKFWAGDQKLLHFDENWRAREKIKKNQKTNIQMDSWLMQKVFDLHLRLKIKNYPKTCWSWSFYRNGKVYRKRK